MVPTEFGIFFSLWKIRPKKQHILRDKWEMDRISDINYATEQGEEKGKKEKQKEIAKKMLQKGISIDEIMELTGLTKEEIEKIQ